MLKNPFDKFKLKVGGSGEAGFSSGGAEADPGYSSDPGSSSHSTNPGVSTYAGPATDPNASAAYVGIKSAAAGGGFADGFSGKGATQEQVEAATRTALEAGNVALAASIAQAYGSTAVLNYLAKDAPQSNKPLNISEAVKARELAASQNTIFNPVTARTPGYFENIAPTPVVGSDAYFNQIAQARMYEPGGAVALTALSNNQIDLWNRRALESNLAPKVSAPSKEKQALTVEAIEEVRQKSGLSTELMEQYYPVKYNKGVGNTDRPMTLPGPMGMTVTSLNPMRPLDLSESQHAINTRPNYVYRSDPLAVALEAGLWAGDTLTFGTWTPGSELLSAKGQNTQDQKYGAFSDYNVYVGKSIQRLLGQEPATLEQFTAYEQTSEFKNLDAILQGAEGGYKVLATDPASIFGSFLQGVEFYAGMGLVGAGFGAIAPEVTGVTRVSGWLGRIGVTTPEMAAPVGLTQTIGSVGVKTISSPVFHAALGTGFAVSGIGTATEWGTLPQSQSASNLGGMYVHLVAMGWGAMAPEGVAKGFAGEGSVINPITVVGKVNPVSTNFGVPIRAATEGEFNYVSTIGLKNPFSNEIPSVKAYWMSGVDIVGTKYGWGSPIPAMRALPKIIVDPLFNVRSPAHTITEPQRLLLDPFFREVSKGTPNEPLINAMFDIKANIGVRVKGGSESILKYTNAQPAGTFEQTGIDPAVQIAVHELFADYGVTRLGSAQQTDWLTLRFMRDTRGSDIDADAIALSFKNLIDKVKVEYSKNTEPVKFTGGGQFSLSSNLEDHVISVSTIERHPDVRSLITNTVSGKEIKGATPEYGMESKAARTLKDRIEYSPDKGVEVDLTGKKQDKDLADMFAAAKGIARTAYEQNQFKMGQMYESIAKNLEIYARSKGMAGVIDTIPENILGTPEAIAAKAKAGLRAGAYRSNIFGVDIPEVRLSEGYPEAYPEFRSEPAKNAVDFAKLVFYNYPVSQREIITKYPTAIGTAETRSVPTSSLYPRALPQPIDASTWFAPVPKYPTSTPQPEYPMFYPQWIPDYPTIYPPATPPPTKYPPAYPPATPPPTKYPPAYPPSYPPIIILPPTHTTPPKKKYKPQSSIIFREILPVITPIEELGGFKQGNAFFRAIGNQQILKVTPEKRDYLHYVDVDQDVRELQKKDNQNKVSDMTGMNFFRTSTKQEKAKTGKVIQTYTPTQQELNMAKLTGITNKKGKKRSWF